MSIFLFTLLLALPPAAQDAVDQGKRADEQQDFVVAIVHFREALQLAPEAPELLFYLGVEESKVPGRELRAIAWLAAYLSVRGDGPEAVKVKAEIQRLRLAHRATLVRVVKPIEGASEFAERKGPSLRDVARKLAEVGDLAAALEVASHLSELPESQAEAFSAIAIVQGLTDTAGALKTVALVPDSQPSKSDALVAIVRTQVARDRAGALKTIGRIQDPLSRDRARRIVSYHLARTHDVAGALKISASILNVEVKSSAHNDIAFVQVDADDFRGARKTALLIPLRSDRDAVLFHIGVTQAGKGDITGALKTAAGSTDSALWSRIARAQAERGDLEGALKTSGEESAGRSLVQASFALSRARAGDVAGARDALVEAVRLADLVTDASGKDEALRQLALVQVDIGDVAGGVALSNRIQDEYWRAQTQTEIAEKQASGGDFAGALQTANEIKYHDKSMQRGAQGTVVAMQAKTGDFAGALRNAESIRTESERARAQATVASVQVAKGDLAGAQETLNSISDSEQRDETQKLIDAARLDAGDLATRWRRRLDDSDLNHDAALNAAPFLDLPAHLQSLSSSGDPRTQFQALCRTFVDMADAERAVNALLEKQGVR